MGRRKKKKTLPIFGKEKKQPREIIFHKTLEKINRAKDDIVKKNDYVPNPILLYEVIKYQELSEFCKAAKKKLNAIENFGHKTEHCQKLVKDLREELQKGQIELFKSDQKLIEYIYKICKKTVGMNSFRRYFSDKEDFINFAMMKVLEKKPWNTFDPTRTKSAFSYFTRTVFNYFIQYIKADNNYNNDKQIILRKMISEFDVKWCKSGIDGQAAILSGGKNYDD
jgi:hypothetical protein